MGENIELIYPLYFKEFKCIGGECEDSCCTGWDIDIDKTTFKEYHKVKDEEMKKMFQKNVHNNNEYTSVDIDYGKVKLKGTKRCPFLDHNNYCMIYSRLGEEYLSNVCTHFPRILNKVDNQYEISLDVACPEAAKILLLKKEGIEFKQSKEYLKKYIISGEINTKDIEFKDSPIKYFKEIREFSIKIMKDKQFDLSERLYILGDFLEKLEEELDYKVDGACEFINKYDMNNAKESYEKNNLNYILQVSFFNKIVNSLKIFEEIDSAYFKEYTKELMAGFDIKNSEDIAKNSEKYIRAFEDYNEKFIKNNSYVFENYLVNFIYNNLFPFSESDLMFDGYIMLLIRYSFIRFYLVGKYLFNKNDSVEEIVKFIQVFSKAIEHDKNYIIEIFDHIKESEFDNMEFAKMIL